MRSRSGHAAFLVLVLLAPAVLLPLCRAEKRFRGPPAVRGTSPTTLHPQWTWHLPAQKPTWPDQPRLSSDVAPRPIAAGGLVLLGSSRTDSLSAYDGRTGERRWQFLADGPVRLAPAVWRDRVYFASDDGHLYCLSLDGELLWKVRGGPSERRVLGNERLISTWPARGGPVVIEEPSSPGQPAQATVYFAAGIWPFMGVFLHALDAHSGEVRWTNSGDGSIFIKQPHQTDSFAGVAPQGSLVVMGDNLLVPGGRSIPACYQRQTGRLLHYRLADGSKLGGGPDVQVGPGLFVNGPGAFDLQTGDYLGSVGEPSIIKGDFLYAQVGNLLTATDLRTVRREPGRKKGLPGRPWLPEPAGALRLPRLTALVAGEGLLYAGAAGEVLAVELGADGVPRRVVSRASVEGTPVSLAVGDNQVFVSTLEGRLLALGGERMRVRQFRPEGPPTPETDRWTEMAARLLKVSRTRSGQAVIWGAGTGRLAVELGRQSDLNIITVEPDRARADSLRRTLLELGVPCAHQSVLAGDFSSARLPPYLCTLMSAEEMPDEVPSLEFLRAIFHSLRPHGGAAYLPLAERHRQGVVRLAASDPILAGARVSSSGPWLVLSREGGLPGAGEWTHQHADAANTRVSRDTLVKAPLGLLWFGGPGNQPILPRHGHGPEPQVIDGRLFIEGVDCLRCLDIYTGRLLWESSLPGLGKAYDNMAHQPGANATSSNFVSARDGIYVSLGSECLRLDPETGKSLGQFRLPSEPGEKTPPSWAFISVVGDALVGGWNPRSREGQSRSKTPPAISSSSSLAVLDRHTGALRWRTRAAQGFRHNAICAGNGRLYTIDRPALDPAARSKRPGAGDEKAVLRAFDLNTGKEVWKATRDVFGTWLSYSEKHDVLVEAGRVGRDSLWDEPRGMRAYRGEGGKVLWYQKDYLGPAMIRGEQILRNADPWAGSGGACELRTGRPILRTDPLTGKQMEWSWTRAYGCNTPMASEHLLTFRSGAAGFFDLCGDGGTGNLGGFRSGCTNNLLVAGGVLVAPDYTRTCTCSYQIQTSVGLIHDPDAEMWTYFGSKSVKGTIRRVGLNLGAPGNRKAEDGTLWLEYPPAGGPSPRLAVRTTPAQPERFRFHSSQVSGSRSPWLGASGLRGLTSLTLTLAESAGPLRPYTVRLYFLEPDHLQSGERVFDVSLQGKAVARDLDVSQEAGGPGKTLVKEFRGIQIGRELTVALAASTPAGPVLSGVEVIAEGW